MSRVMTKRRGHGHGHGRKNKRTMRRRRSHSAHLTRSRRHRHGSRSRARRGGMFAAAAEVSSANKAVKAAGLAVKGIQKYKDTKAYIRDKASREASAAAIRGQIIPSSGTFGATASNFRPSSFPSRASSGSPHRRRATAASPANLQVVPGRLSAVHEDKLALLTSNRFASSRLANTGASAASAAHDGMDD